MGKAISSRQLLTTLNMSIFSTQFFWIFLTCYLLYQFIVVGLDLINYFHTQKLSRIPEYFGHQFDERLLNKSKAYTLDKIRFGLFSHLMQIPFFWLLIVLGGFNSFDYYAIEMGGWDTITRSVLFCFMIAAYFLITSLPFRYYSIFVVEERHGFNKMTPEIFMADLMKSILLSVAIGTPLLYIVFWFMRSSGGLWWLWVWGVITLFQLFFTAVYPMLLAPLFNKFEPLKDENLKKKIEELAQKIGFKMSGIYTMDGSKRSGHSNAYFAGIGRFRRIVLFDTLIKQMSEAELLAVLAHEMGHNVKKHITKSVILSIALTGVSFYIMSLLLDWPEFYTAFNIMYPSPHAALVIFAVCSEVFTILITPMINLWSRKNEYEADRFSVEICGNKDAMKNSLLKLTQENLSNLSPHPLYSFFHYSHPTPEERLKAIDQIPLQTES